MNKMVKSDTIELLQELLEGERAGARIALDSLKEAHDERQATLLSQILIGEVESCRLIINCINYLGDLPSPNIGDFYIKAMRIENIIDRINFIDKGQRWVIKKINKHLELTSSEFVRKELEMVLDIHILNSNAIN
ncbi:DUF6306 domain-containing protein [Pseudomonas sp. CCI1.2]|uniref:DUF6306 domain-containing protein n=1 Tax=Pseudomonas sp. CCI1.2 TaxID=3048614 RepID=UPI002B223357|nr:DUF6306 domain-containing protein [Pseudomonas sp. CCI1.2]MEB0121595.1 DUF6306 domain-containing protein [Pseudomonas sp. CCI1.2]